MPKVTFQNTGQSVDADEGAELRDVTQKNGWPIPYGCENGICGTCLIKVSENKEGLTEETEHEAQTLKAMGKADGEHRLACQCKIKGDCTIEQ
ncbi:(2Fe-2S)-binding protein [Candidatus Peregrinibacteria bacterium]|jgi:ferredoxin|nr:(2Fe-2S)-binding protein [Candidatus Peregrinibacteria bacterium]MBT7484501.1 (2Fe-2S)-binding protein [Candidatus Peregrinibacteria bacterium]MBT7703406.1 (2Fe-2S)-binding protein [Candidatus Peregrinibacteria bacterium]